MHQRKPGRRTGYIVRAHRVVRDDSLPNIVARAGLAGLDWRTIYGADYNRALRRTRPDPHEIKKGDVVHLPPCPPRVLKELFVELSRFRIKVERARSDLMDSGRSETNRRLEDRVAAIAAICRAMAGAFDSACARAAHCGDLQLLAAREGREAEALQAAVGSLNCVGRHPGGRPEDGAALTAMIDRAKKILNLLRAALVDHEDFVKCLMSDSED